MDKAQEALRPDLYIILIAIWIYVVFRPDILLIYLIICFSYCFSEEKDGFPRYRKNAKGKIKD